MRRVVTIINAKGEAFIYDLPMSDEGRAMQIADEIVFKRQREWSGLFMRDNIKLRQIIADAIIAAVKAEREAAKDPA